MASAAHLSDNICPVCDGFLREPDSIRQQCHCPKRGMPSPPVQLPVRERSEPPATPPSYEERPTFTRFTAAKFVERPAQIYLVDHLLAYNSTAAIVAPPGEYKTFLALHLGGCCATGRPFYGHVCAKVRVLYLLAEGSDGFVRRLQAWAKAFRVDLNQLPLEIIPLAVQLCDQTQHTTLLNTIGDMAERPGLVIVDTLARSFVGGEENSAKDMGKLVDALNQIRAFTGGCVLGLHHVTKSGGIIRGSSALEGALDTLISIEKTGDLGAKVACLKQKDAAEFEPIYLQGRVIELDSPDATSLVFDIAESITEDFGPLTDKVRAVLAELDGLGPATVSNSEWRKACDAQHINERAFYRSRKTLLALDLVSPETVGKQTRYRVAAPGPKEWEGGTVDPSTFHAWAVQERAKLDKPKVRF
jgi:AAA domain